MRESVPWFGAPQSSKTMLMSWRDRHIRLRNSDSVRGPWRAMDCSRQVMGRGRLGFKKLPLDLRGGDRDQKLRGVEWDPGQAGMD